MKEDNCKQLVNRYLLNRMSDEEEAAFQKHLAECKECRDYLERVRNARKALVDSEETVVVELKPKRKLVVYYSVAAAVLLLLVSGLLIYMVNDNGSADATYTNMAKVSDSVVMTAKPVQKVVSDDTVSTCGVKTEGVKKGGERTVSTEETYVVSKGKNPPSVARAVVVTGGGVATDASRSYVLPDEAIKFGELLTPKSLVCRVQNDSVFEFKWNTYYDTPFFVYIKPDGGVLENYHDTGDSFELDLRQYKNNDSLEWNVKIVGETGAIRHKGVIYIDK